jgi:hypothetical protein
MATTQNKYKDYTSFFGIKIINYFAYIEHMQNSSEELLTLSNEYIKGQYSISIYNGEG